MTTVYRKYIDFDGCTVLRDKYGEPPPGDPDGPWQKRSTQLARGHKIQELWDWEYKATATGTPPGDGWELNTYAGDQGLELTRDGGGRPMQVTYWRRRKP